VSRTHYIKGSLSSVLASVDFQSSDPVAGHLKILHFLLAFYLSTRDNHNFLIPKFICTNTVADLRESPTPLPLSPLILESQREEKPAGPVALMFPFPKDYLT